MYPSITAGSSPETAMVKNPPPPGPQMPGSVHIAVRAATIATSTTVPPPSPASTAASVTTRDGPATAIRGTATG